MIKSLGFFEWKRRMGVHQAYHRNLHNRILHWICIPLELWAVIKLLSFIPIGNGWTLASIIVVALFPVFLLTELLIGSLMIGFLVGCLWTSSHFFADSTIIGALFAVALFVITFSIQVLVGHQILEDGRDDTKKNLGEFSRTKNPVPLVLVFYYHLVEAILCLGYRPSLAREIEQFALLESSRIK